MRVAVLTAVILLALQRMIRRHGWYLREIVSPPLMKRDRANKWRHGGRRGKQRPTVTDWYRARTWSEYREMRSQGWSRQRSIGRLLNPKLYFKGAVLGQPT